MSNPIEQSLNLLREQLKRLDDERKQVEEAIRALTHLDKPAARKPAARKPAARKTAKRSGPSTTQRFIDLVAKQPGITVAEAAKQLKVPTNSLYATAANLAKTGRVKKNGPKYSPAAGKKSAAKKAPAKKKPAAKK